mgnify:CR=1 FL=1
MMFKRIGILGGGQLGRMLQEVAQRWNMPVYCMDSSDDAPATLFNGFYTQGDIRNYEDVMAFAQDKDVITIEIEHVNLQALNELQALGKEIHPNPNALEIIKNKNTQKEFYKKLSIPVPEFTTFENKTQALEVFAKWKGKLPCIYKSAEMGYDGKGVRTIHSMDDVHELDDIAGAFEDKIDIGIEVAVMLAANPDGQLAVYSPVAMHFDHDNHILSEVHYPYELPEAQVYEMNSIAKKIMLELKLCGICAFEFFITNDGKVFLNEIAPRPHNSMHLSIDNAVCSQFEMHLRAISNLPLGSTKMNTPGIMYNVIGEEGDKGNSDFDGWHQTLNEAGVYVHLYGKTTIKPARKMGHINIVGDDVKLLKDKLEIVKSNFKNIKNG